MSEDKIDIVLKSQIDLLNTFKKTVVLLSTISEKIDEMKEEIASIKRTYPVYKSEENTDVVSTQDKRTEPTEALADYTHRQGVSVSDGMDIVDRLDEITKELKVGCRVANIIDIIETHKSSIENMAGSRTVMSNINTWLDILYKYPNKKLDEVQMKDISIIKKSISEVIGTIGRI